MHLNIKKDHYPLLIALTLPILLFIVVWITNFLPGLFLKPQYDFIYFNAKNLPYGVRSEFYVIDPYTKKIVKDEPIFEEYYWKENPNETLQSAKSKITYPTLYLYDVSKRQSRAITLEEVNQYIIDNSVKSPDGYEIKNGTRVSYDFIFPSTYTDYSKWILVKNGHKFELNLATDNIKDSGYYDSYSNMKFLGWKIN